MYQMILLTWEGNLAVCNLQTQQSFFISKGQLKNIDCSYSLFMHASIIDNAEIKTKSSLVRKL